MKLEEIVAKRGQHPPWCARDHRCDAQLGGLHRSLPEEWEMPVGRLAAWREGRRRGQVVVQWSKAIPQDEAAMAARLRAALEAFQRVLLDG
jgi:hypothetical protein